MAIPQTKLTYTRSQFEAFVRLPENENRMWELIDGEAVEKMPSNPVSSWIASRINYAIFRYLEESETAGYVTGEAAGYYVGNEVLSPDVAYTIQSLVPSGFQPTPPELAIEVVSPSDDPGTVMLKLRKYMGAEVVVWVVYPKEQVVDVWVPNQPVSSVGLDGTLAAPDILPGFSISVRDILGVAK